MRFEPGKYYRHTSGQIIAILGFMDTAMWGKTLVAELAGLTSHELRPVGWDDDGYAQNWVEVPRDEWMKNFKGG